MAKAESFGKELSLAEPCALERRLYTSYHLGAYTDSRCSMKTRFHFPAHLPNNKLELQRHTSHYRHSHANDLTTCFVPSHQGTVTIRYTVVELQNSYDDMWHTEKGEMFEASTARVTSYVSFLA